MKMKEQVQSNVLHILSIAIEGYIIIVAGIHEEVMLFIFVIGG